MKQHDDRRDIDSAQLEGVLAVGSVVNAIAILRHLAEFESQGVNLIARELGISPSSCFSILKTLVEERFLDFDPTTKRYRLSEEPAKIFHVEPRLTEWTQWVRNALAVMAKEFEIGCGLWRVAGNRATLTEVALSPVLTRIHLSVGQRLPAHIGAMGRCIAARKSLSSDAIQEIINGLRWQSPPSVEEYRRGMEESLQTGWALDEGNYLRGINSLAAAISDQHGEVRYCITCTAFNGQFEHSVLEEIGSRVAELACQAEDRLNRRAQPPQHRGRSQRADGGDCHAV